ncbi:unnamed protein product [Rotaria sp. Silwood2]|nr:unnamed protein product [Rotaria sp. Silwood2]
MRSNARWFEISHAVQNGIRFFTNDNRSHTYGYLGECELSELAFIDRGISFMSDTLHSIYHGAFKKLMQLWTESPKTQPWSLSKLLLSIDCDLSKIVYPTTTSTIINWISDFQELLTICILQTFTEISIWHQHWRIFQHFNGNVG